MKTLLLIRGLPGSGKTTLGAFLSSMAAGGYAVHFEADRYFERCEGGVTRYDFDASKLRQAHEDCESKTAHALASGVPFVIVSNTSTQDWEVERYQSIASTHGYRFVSVIAENRHGGESVHDVPDETVERMRDRFDINL